MSQRSKKVLLVEDEAVLVEMYQKKFRQMGLEILSATNVIDGLSLAEKEKPDLIVLDILFSEKDGLFFLREQKKNPRIAHIPVIVFSNYDDPATKKEVQRMGVKDYLIKSNYTPEQIGQKIWAILYGQNTNHKNS